MFNSLICHKLFILPEPGGSMEMHIQRAGMGRSRVIAYPKPFAPSLCAHIRSRSFLHLFFFMARRDLTPSGVFAGGGSRRKKVEALRRPG